MRLDHVAEVFSGGPELRPDDIAIVRVHGIREIIGKPSYGKYPQLPTNSIVVRARPKLITPKKLFYTLEYLHRKGAFAYLAHGTCQLSIRVGEIKKIDIEKVPEPPEAPKPADRISKSQKKAWYLGAKYAELFYYTARTKGITESLKEESCSGILIKFQNELILPLKKFFSGENFKALIEGYVRGIEYLTRQSGWGAARYQDWR